MSNEKNLTPEEAENLYAQLHAEAGALSDKEVDNVAGGTHWWQIVKSSATLGGKDFKSGKKAQIFSRTIRGRLIMELTTV